MPNKHLGRRLRNIAERMSRPSEAEHEAWPIAVEPGSDFSMDAEALIRTYREAQKAEAIRARKIERRGD